MAGQAAGTLEIQLVSDISRLQKDMREAQRTLDGFTKSGEAGAQRMGNAFQKAGQQVTASAGAQRAGMQQLTMQIGDMATMYALGAKPMQIFASQSAQVIGAIQLMSGGASKFATFMGGPWGAALTAGTLILAPFVAKLFEGETALKAAEFASYGMKDAQSILAGVMDLTTGKINTQSAALHGLAQAQALAMQVQARARQAEAASQIQAARDPQWYMEGGMGGGLSIGRRRGAAAGVVTQFQSGDLSAKDTIQRLDELRAAGKLTEQTFLDLSAAVANFGVEGENIKVAENLEKALNGDTKATQGFLENKKKRQSASEKLAERLARESSALESLISGLYKAADAYQVSTAAGQRARVEAEAMEKGIRKQADVQAYVAQQQRKYVAEVVAGSAQQTAELKDQVKAQEFVNDAVKRGAIEAEDATEALSSMAEQRALMTAQSVAAANNDVKGYEAATKALNNLTEAQLRDIAARKEAADLSRAAQTNDQIESVELETQLMKDLGAARINAMRGLSGNALDEELARIAAEHEKIAIQARAEAEAAQYLKIGYDDAAEAVMRKAEADKTQVDARLEIERQIRAIEILNDRVNALSGAFSNIKGAGPLGDIFDVLTSRDPTAALLNMGGVGTLLGMFTKGGGEAYLRMGDEMTRALESVFGPKATGLANTLGQFLQGSGTGSIVGSLLGGGKEAQLGSSLGGAIGQAVGTKLLSSLGNAAGPIGAIGGAIAGQLLGSLLASTPRGSATFGDSGLVSTRGNSKARIAGATKAGNSALDLFDSLLEELGATASGINFSAGIRKKNFVLDPSGQGRTKGSGVLNFGQDEEAYLKGLMQEIISDATFEGLSAGFNNYLKTGAGDIADRIQDVLGLKGAMDELSAIKDPQAADLGALDKAFEHLREIAKATGEGLTEIEELYGIKRKDIVDKYAQEALEKENTLNSMRVEILELEGKSTEALALARQIETSTMSESERALQQRIYALQDEAAATAKAAAVAQEKRGLEIRLAEALGNEQDALRMRREDELAALDPLNRSLLEYIYTVEDAAAATQRAAAAQAQAAQQAQAAMSSSLGLLGGIGGGGGNIVGMMQDPIMGGAISWLQGGGDIAGAKAIWDAAIKKQALTAFPNDVAGQQKYIQQYMAGVNQAAGYGLDGRPNLSGIGGNGGVIGSSYFWGNPDKQSANSEMQGLSDQANQAVAARRAQQRAEAEAKQTEAVNKLTEAYEREKSAFEDVADKFRDVIKALEEYRSSLTDQLRSPTQTFQQMQIDLMKAGASTDADVLAGIPGMGDKFLEMALSRSSTESDYKRQIAFVQSIVDQAIGGATDQVDYQQAQLDALNRQVEGQIKIEDAVKENTATVKELLAEVKGTRSEQLQLGLKIEGNTFRTDRTLKFSTRNGNAMQVEQDL